jgi:hypothetical protein
MNVAIIGSRLRTATPDVRAEAKALVNAIVDALPQGSVLISGGAEGVDTYAYRRARERGLDYKTIVPEWKKLGKAAGMIRNKRIIELSDVVYAIWDGESPGTRGAIAIARAANKEVLVFDVGK